MLHFTCDLCGQKLTNQRYIAKVEVYPAFDPDELNELDLDTDHLQEIAEKIESMDADDAEDLSATEAQEFRFDFCPQCSHRFRNDPLSRDAFRRLNFSDN
jgi:hypothetical protein